MLINEARGLSARSAALTIHRESTWFDRPHTPDADFSGSRIVASRWVGAGEGQQHESTIEPACHMLAIALRPMDEVTVFAARKLITSGPLPRGAMRVHEPGLEMRGTFRGAYDALHLRIPSSLIAEYAGAASDNQRRPPLVRDHPVVDPLMEQLARAFVHAEELGAFGQCYADGLSLAIMARLFGADPGGSPTRGSRVSRLSRWRLKRATEFIEANLGDPIGLVEIAAAAGLSRMHFAAQFRVATGQKPHEYLMRQRVKRAQQLLLATHRPLVEVALDTGFQNQAHFTTVFGQFVGETPNVWRRHHRHGSHGF